MNPALITTLFLAILLGACAQPATEPDGSAIPYFSDEQELLTYLQNQDSSPRDAVFFDATSRLSLSAESSAGAAEYSETNIQVEGVDEADIVKSDGKYLYILAGEALVILDAYPAEEAEVRSETLLRGSPTNILLEGDVLVVFSQDTEEQLTWPEYSILPQPRYVPITNAYIYDVTDRGNPELINTIEMSGGYTESRKLDGHVYVVTNEQTYYSEDRVYTPFVRSNDDRVTPRIHYFDNPEPQYQYTTITSFTTDGESLTAESYLTGYANTVYMSTEALYIAYQKNTPWRDEQRERFMDVVLPILPTTLQAAITAEDDWEQIAQLLEEYFDNLEEEEREELYEEMAEAIDEYEAERARERSRTIIHKIGVDEGSFNYAAQGEIPGTLLNQFSLDENERNLRVATTVSAWTSRNVQYNNVYVLGANLELLGALEGIAEDERIYSTRFLGDRLYMVTFRQVDPFFVIDLADPEQPTVLGELKIPGWSSYLHPYDENHIIGIGKQTKENEWGGVTTLGVKMSLFDVRDVYNPQEIDTYEIGGSGSDSEVLRDHKAFLFDKERELLVLPIREVNEGGLRQQRVWQGAYVFRITEEGFDFRDRIAHYDGFKEQYWNWWGSTSTVRRAAYMDDVLYTISLEKVRAHDLDTLDSIKTIELPYERPDYGYPEPRPIDVIRAE